MIDPNQYDCSPPVEFAAKAFIASWLINHDERIEKYMSDLPEDMLAEAHDVMIRLEIYMRTSKGEEPDQIEYLSRFPEYAVEVQAAFENDTSLMSDASSVNGDEKDETITDSMISESAGFLLAKSQPDVIPDMVGRYKVEKELGRGGFGVVCLAHDTQLDRKVALKFARTSRFSTVEEMEKLIDEARTAAKLDCPGIVSVYDVIVGDEFICIVQQLVEGHDLAEELAEGRPTFMDAASWMASICSAIAVAHSKGFIHRDLKPANILMDRNSQPLITDFGLAIHESFQRRRRGDRSGTPRYMSPELVRGESHRIDGRSDIWSLGVILYQMLTGKRPFSGESAVEIFDEIKYREPRPPREIRPEIPLELERICLKCLSKPVAQRYATARDLARDLNRWIQDSSVQSVSDSMSDRITDVVPKGLRSFDEEDAEFFLMLLPGPVGRSGLPDSVQAWKRRLCKETDNPLTVGVLYGPTGCGKSSYVKAGLLPYLPGNFQKFFVEATPVDTELRLIKSIRSRYSRIPSSLTLPELFQSIREGVWTEGGERVLIVIDQFEQWLHNRNSFDGTELVEALRQCDGHRLQCLLMVRDDFWLATSRFLHALEVDLVEGKNAALIDLFDVPHAERVLKQYGRGYGRILEEVTPQQEEFIKLAVEQLAEDGKVICVRLSLFAEMFKDKPWNVSSLKRAGGISGVGVAFLEETFSSKNSPSKNRVHEAAARNVLGALLPESSVDIRGNMRSRQDLLHISGYANRPNAFLDLLNLLDHDLRLITPTDPSGLEDQKAYDPGASHDFYQLTHDYLVTPLRSWLYQKNRETISGRAQLKLDERHATWARTEENRFLPAVVEYLNIRLFTRPKNWSEGEKVMMRRADRRYRFQFAVVAAVVVLSTFLGMFWYGNVQANSLANRLVDAELSEVPAIVAEMKDRKLSEKVASKIDSEDLGADRRKQLNYEVAFSDNSENRNRLWQRLNEEVNAEEAVIVAAAYHPNETEVEEFWSFLRSERATSTDRKRLRVATALSTWDAEDARWQDVSYSVAGSLLAQNPIFVEGWFEAMPTIRVQMLRALITHVSEWQMGSDQQKAKSAISLIKEHQSDWPKMVEHLQTEIIRSDFGRQVGAKPESDMAVFESMTQQQANLSVTMLVLGHTEQVLDLMNLPANDRLRQMVIKQAVDFSLEPALIIQCLEAERRPVGRSVLWLMLGNFANLETGLPDSALQLAKQDYRSNPNAIVHSATEWFIRQNAQDDWIHRQEVADAATIRENLIKDTSNLRYPVEQDWRRTVEQQTMIRITAPGPFSMSFRRTANINYDFEVSAKEVSIAQFLRFNDGLSPVNDLVAGSDQPESKSLLRPVTDVNWHQAAEYCNWLSRQEGIPEDQWCYEVDPVPVEGSKYYEQPAPREPGKPRLRLVKDFQARSGYRLPLESEWEYLASPSWNPSFETASYSQTLIDYEWFNDNAITKPVGTKKPGRYGVFDIFANAQELCSDSMTYDHLYPSNAAKKGFQLKEGSVYQDPIEIAREFPFVWKSDYRKLRRGISVFDRGLDQNRYLINPTGVSGQCGFRIVRKIQNHE